tara:strand:- start:542 stop:781 length:240 start_codon:yes stop_codon:yes gene_type:complete
MFHIPNSGKIKWYWKVAPLNEAARPLTPDPENSEKYLKNPDQYFEGIRGIAATRNEAQALVDANVANVLENGVTGITAL